jgi:predicted MPP superfamily phosphohydrolase
VSWHIGGVVPREQDYRNPAVIEGLIPERGRGGVMLLGTSRIGKTTLLMRIHENSVWRSCEPIHVGTGTSAVFEKLKGREELLLLDEAQELTKWSDENLRELQARIAGRPFVLAAWPTLQASQKPDELWRLLEGVRPEWLHPLSDTEAAEMIRRARSATPVGCGVEVVRAIYQATAGFPNLIAGLCRFLTSNGEPLASPTAEDLEGFTNSSICEGSFRDIYRSLPARMQVRLDECSRGTRTRLEVFRELGLVSGTPAVFRGSLFESFWGPGGVWESILDAGKQSQRNIVRAPRPALTWLHVSDLHFGAGPQSHRFNQEVITEEILKDVRGRRPWDPDFIFVTGDIAFSADPKQYEKADLWFRQLAEAAGVSPSVLRFVPGNHDVDRGLARKDSDTLTIIRGVNAAKEKSPVALLDERLHDPTKRKTLQEKLKAYVRFVNDLVSDHPKSDKAPLDWFQGVEPTPQRPGRIWLIGLCSVWVSDEHDAERKLVVGERQLRMLKDVQEEDLVLLLSHHPPGWLHPNAEDLLLERLAERAHHVHLCGHVHAAAARSLRGLGMLRDSLRLVAGAGHGESSGEHGYAWGALRWNRDEWQIGWAPRIFERGRGMRPDLNRYDLDDLDFAWEPLAKLKWSAPG